MIKFCCGFEREMYRLIEDFIYKVNNRVPGSDLFDLSMKMRDKAEAIIKEYTVDG